MFKYIATSLIKYRDHCYEVVSLGPKSYISIPKGQIPLPDFIQMKAQNRIEVLMWAPNYYYVDVSDTINEQLRKRV